MYCNKCGNELKEDMIYCNKCGNKVVNIVENQDNSVNNSNEIKAKGNRDVNVQGQNENNSMITLNILYNRETMLSPKSWQILVDGKNFEINDNKITTIQIEKKDEHIIEWVKDEPTNFKFTNNEKEMNIHLEFHAVDGVHFNLINSYEDMKKYIKADNVKNKPLNKLVITILIIVGIVAIITMLNKIINKNTKEDTIDKTTYNKEVQYGDSKYENSIYGEKVVRGYYNRFASIDSYVGKIISIKDSEFLEKDNYGRYAFKVTFTYNPKNGSGTTMLDRESTKTVIAIYTLNLKDPDGVYVGLSNVIVTTTDWNTAKKYKDLCGGAWDTPLTLNFGD